MATGLAFAVAGCSAWHATRLAAPAPPTASDSAATPAAMPSGDLGSVRVVSADGSTVELRHAHFEGDSLVGEARRASLLGSGPRRVALARADVRHVDRWEFSTAKTAGLLLLVATTGGLLVRALVGGLGGNGSD